MFARPSTIKDAAELWVSNFNAIKQDMLARLMKYEPDKWREVTAPVVGDEVYVFNASDCGEIIEYDNESGDYRIKLMDGSKIYAQAYNFEVLHDDGLPMWGTMWSFGDNLDDMWLKDFGGLELMSELGFRVYEHDDFGYYFGIDGAGYDFYEAHWIPLYKARGLEWHKEC